MAGLLVVTAEETRKLPTRVFTLPMSAVSRGLQAGMRLQQSIAELAIKGDELLSPVFDKPEEQPVWAHFDEDDLPPVGGTTSSDATPTATGTSPVTAKQAPAAAKAQAAQPATEPASSAEPAAADTPDPSAGRFALYSSPTADVTPAPTVATPVASAPSGPMPAVVDELDYDQLTLAQLRAKVRSVDIDALRELADYERAGRNRKPFITMIENRVATAERKNG